jgi:hypothetical protein
MVRESWSEEDGYLVLLEGMKHCWKILTKPTVNAGNHIFSVEELSASDWMKLGEKKEEAECIVAEDGA